MHYGAMALQDYDQVMALCAGQAGVLIRDADSPEHFARYLQRNPGLSFVARNGAALAGCILCGHDGRRGYLNHLVVEEGHHFERWASASVSSSSRALSTALTAFSTNSGPPNARIW